MEYLHRMGALEIRHILYIAELMLYVPVLVIIHFWILFVPHGSGSVLFWLWCFLIRYGVSLLLLDAFLLTRRQILGFYVIAIPYLVFGYVLTSCRQTAPNLASDNSTFVYSSLAIVAIPFVLSILPVSCPRLVVVSWLQTITILIMIMFLYYINSTDFANCLYLLFIIILNLMAMISDIPATIRSRNGHNKNMFLQYVFDENRTIKFPFHHIFPMFCVSYYTYAVVSELRNDMPLQALISMPTLIRIIVNWCTNCIVLISILSIQVLIGYIIIITIRYCLINMRENRQRWRRLFYTGRANIMMGYTIPFPIIAEFMKENEEDKSTIISVILYAIFAEFINETWLMLRCFITQIGTNAAERSLRVYIEVLICIMSIILVSVLTPLSIASQFKLSLWSPIFTVQSLMLAFDAVMTFVEYTVNVNSWSFSIYRIKTQDVIYYIRLLKSIGIIFCFFLEGYNLSSFPLLKKRQLSVLIISVTNLIFMWKVAAPFVLLECIQLLQRTESREFQNILPAATPEEISELDDVCAICLDEMDDGVVTPCKHIFHFECLWTASGLRQFCPKCKNSIFTFSNTHQSLVIFVNEMDIIDHTTRQYLGLVNRAGFTP